METRVLGRWRRMDANGTEEVLCFGADGTCTGLSMYGVGRWRAVRSYGNTLVFDLETSEPHSDLVFTHEMTVVLDDDGLRERGALFERIEDRVESCPAR